MLNQMLCQPAPMASCCTDQENDYRKRFKRDEKEDTKRAIDLMYEFKNKLDELHPMATIVVEKLLSYR